MSSPWRWPLGRKRTLRRRPLVDMLTKRCVGAQWQGVAQTAYLDPTPTPPPPGPSNEGTMMLLLRGA